MEKKSKAETYAVTPPGYAVAAGAQVDSARWPSNGLPSLMRLVSLTATWYDHTHWLHLAQSFAYTEIMEKRDRIDDIIDIALPMPDPAPHDADEPNRAAREAMRGEVARQREVFEHYLRTADAADEAHGGFLALEIDRARTEMRDAEERMRMLIAYGREFISPQPYPLKTLAEAAGMSISGTRSAYTVDEIAAVAARIGRQPVRSEAKGS